MIGLAAGLLVMVIEFTVVPEQREAFVAISAEQVDAVRAREGNRGFDVLVDPKRPDKVVYIERWETPEQQEAFFQWWIGQGLTEKLRPYVTATPAISTYETID
jgi:quinol monooxygenase YgiN